jgi:hypothetical protein
MINEDDLKPIPYGVTDFNDFRVKNYYYVDKTRFIRDIEKKVSFYFSFARGVSGNLSS